MKLFLSIIFLSQLTLALTKIPNSMLLGPTTLTAVSGTLGIANGGTGQVLKTPAFNALSPLTTKGDLLVIIASGDNTRRAVGTDGQVLTADSSDATGVKWATPSTVSTSNVITKTTTYTALVTDDIINASGSAFTITLYAVSGNSGKSIVIKKTDSSLTNIITIDGNASETLDGALTTTLNTQYETVTLYCDGTSWHIRNRHIPSYVGTFTPTGSWSTNTTYTGRKRRIGDSYEYMIKVSTSGAPTAASLTITIPDTIDTSKLTSTVIYASAFESSGMANDSGTAYPVKVLYNSTTVVSVVTGANPAGLVSNTVPFAFGASDEINVRFTLPIVGLNN